MPTECSRAPVMAWSWIIQSLASFKLVEPSTLVGLVKKAPAIPDDLGKDAREMVSLRILESLFDYGNEATVEADSAQAAKICFDPSERCEDVLRKILDETSEPMSELERQKWNVRPFIMHKRSSLPKTPLQKLKEALLEGGYPLLPSLKEKSKMGVANISENASHGVDLDAQTTVAEDSLGSPKPTNENNKFQENPLEKSDQTQNSTRGITEDTGRKESETSIEHPVKGIDENALNDQPNVSNIRHETGTENERSDDEWTDVAAKKEAFLSSQCTLSQDSMAVAGLTEISLCMKCNDGGQLLVCSSDACPLRIHESCLGSIITLDENGNFFCPFCAYSRAISKYLEAKKKASMARKDLQAFLSSGVKCRPKTTSTEEAGLEKNESRKMRALGETHEANGNGGGASRDKTKTTICLSNKDNFTLPEPSRVMNSGDKGAPLSDLSLSEEEHQPSSKEVSETHLNSGCLNQPTSDLVQRPAPQSRTPKLKRNEKERRTSCVSSHSRRCHKRKPQYTSPSGPLLRRKALPWTKAEEEILKEGVQRFSSVDRKGIPWKEILDFGRDVFDKGRTAIDLKDKWRNVCKGSPAPKKRKL